MAEPGGVLTAPACTAPDRLPLALFQATPDNKSGTLQLATVCGGALKFSKAAPSLTNLTTGAWTSAGVIAVESTQGSRDRFVQLLADGTRKPYLATLPGTLIGIGRDNIGRPVFSRYDPQTKLYFVQRIDADGQVRTVLSLSAFFVFGPAVSPSGTYAIPETFRSAKGLEGRIELIGADGKQSRVFPVPGDPTDITWLDRSTLLVRADTPDNRATDYTYSLTTHKVTPLAGGWLTLCAYGSSVVVTRVGGSIGILPKAHPDRDAVQIVGKLRQLPLACAPTEPEPSP